MVTREPLTVEKLRALPFRMTLHINRGREHDRVDSNDEFGIHVAVTTRKPRYEVVSRLLYSTRFPKGEHVVDLLADDAMQQLERFCEAYNALPEGS